jgi:zinc protease
MSETTPLRLEYGDGPDGIRLAVQPAPVGAASFSATYVAPAGWGFDPIRGASTARFVNHLLTSATRRLDRVELARALDAAGATLSRQTSPESGEVTIWGPAGDWVRLLALLGEVVRTPRFDPDDIARVRRQFLERQLREATQPGARAERELLRGVFPSGHPYRSTGLGDRASVGRVTRTALQKFHREHYLAAGGLLVVTTSARRAAAESAARRAFGRGFSAPAPSLRFPALRTHAPAPTSVDMPGRSQVEIRFGGPSIPQDAPEYPASFLANEVLGGRPLLSRLFQRIREQNGLAYHASSHLDTMRWGGIWTAQAGTGADRWKKVVPMLEEEIDRIRDVRVPVRELSAIRRSAIGEIPLALESTAEAHELAVDVAYHELAPDYLVTWPARLEAISPRDVEEAATIAFERRGSVAAIAGPIGASR